jgi:hypothetical protein
VALQSFARLAHAFTVRSALLDLVRHLLSHGLRYRHLVIVIPLARLAVDRLLVTLQGVMMMMMLKDRGCADAMGYAVEGSRCRGASQRGRRRQLQQQHSAPSQQEQEGLRCSRSAARAVTCCSEVTKHGMQAMHGNTCMQACSRRKHAGFGERQSCSRRIGHERHRVIDQAVGVSAHMCSSAALQLSAAHQYQDDDHQPPLKLQIAVAAPLHGHATPSQCPLEPASGVSNQRGTLCVA